VARGTVNALLKPLLKTVTAGGVAREIVIVDPSCDRHADFVAAATAGAIGLHFCRDGGSALRLARRFRADAWLVAAELPDMAGVDLVEMLPRTIGAAAPAGPRDLEARPGIFLFSEAYRPEDEQRALASGVAGYLVRRLTPGLIVPSREPRSLDRSLRPLWQAARSGVALQGNRGL